MSYAGDMPTLPVTEPEIDVFLAAFEGGRLPKTEWTHAAHLLTGACYVHTLGQNAALKKIAIACDGIMSQSAQSTAKPADITRP